MIFLLGINLKNNKNIYLSLKQCYGISTRNSLCLISKFGVNRISIYQTMPEVLRSQIEFSLDKIVEKVYKIKIGNFLIHARANFYQKLMSLRIYRALRHKQNLPVRGQRTHSNAKTQKSKLKNRLQILKLKVKIKK